MNSGCSQSGDTLNVYIYADFIDPQVVAKFEQSHHCKVSLNYFNSGDSVMAKLSAGGSSVYDIVCVGDGEVPAFEGLGLLAPLRHENLPNLKNLDNELMRESTDPNHLRSIPYSWSYMGIYLRRSPLKQADETWGLLFDPAKQPGPFVLIDDSRTCIAAALCYKGYSINTTNEQQLTEARDLLIKAKQRSLGFDIPVALRNRVRSKAATAAISFSGAEAPGEKDPETYFFVPREGSFIGMDCLAIPSEAPHRDLAEKFLNFILDPHIGAQNAMAIGGATANKAAFDLLPQEVRHDPALYPTPEASRRLQFIKDVGLYTKLYDEIWTQIKAQ